MHEFLAPAITEIATASASAPAHLGFVPKEGRLV